MAKNQDDQPSQVDETQNESQKTGMSQYEMAMYCHVDYYEEYDENGAPID
ncbi:MAG: hypothetical protein WCT50_02715 [Patescibacteria group bacterium]